MRPWIRSISAWTERSSRSMARMSSMRSALAWSASMRPSVASRLRSWDSRSVYSSVTSLLEMLSLATFVTWPPRARSSGKTWSKLAAGMRLGGEDVASARCGRRSHALYAVADVLHGKL